MYRPTLPAIWEGPAVLLIDPNLCLVGSQWQPRRMKVERMMLETMTELTTVLSDYYCVFDSLITLKVGQKTSP